jgi:hypothetical protein
MLKQSNIKKYNTEFTQNKPVRNYVSIRLRVKQNCFLKIAVTKRLMTALKLAFEHCVRHAPSR